MYALEQLRLRLPCCALLLAVVVVVGGMSTTSAATTAAKCHGKVCHPVEEYCSDFSETCAACATICDASSHNFHVDECASKCAEYNKYEPLKAEIHTIKTQLNLTLVLLIVLLVLIAVRYAYKCMRWLRHKSCITVVLKKLQPNKFHGSHAHNGKDLGGTTIQNVMTINEIENAPSQIYSVTGAEGSVMTVTTPVSTRYPAENSSTPTSVPQAEYSYDNQALAVTPVSDKPSATQVF